MTNRPRLLFMCGKMAAGKSALAIELARSRSALLFVQDQWLEALSPGDMVDLPAFIDRSARLRRALEPTIGSVLAKGVSVVLDFPGNTRKQRAWFRALAEAAAVDHELHFVDVSDALCKAQLAARRRGLQQGTAVKESDGCTEH